MKHTTTTQYKHKPLCISKCTRDCFYPNKMTVFVVRHDDAYVRSLGHSNPLGRGFLFCLYCTYCVLVIISSFTMYICTVGWQHCHFWLHLHLYCIVECDCIVTAFIFITSILNMSKFTCKNCFASLRLLRTWQITETPKRAQFSFDS